MSNFNRSQSMIRSAAKYTATTKLRTVGTSTQAWDTAYDTNTTKVSTKITKVTKVEVVDPYADLRNCMI